MAINLYKNIVPKGDTFEKLTRIYTIHSLKNVEDIAEENNLSEIDQKVLNQIVNKRFNKYVDSKEAKELIEVNNIFAS